MILPLSCGLGTNISLTQSPPRSEREAGGFFIFDVFPRLRDTLTRGFWIGEGRPQRAGGNYNFFPRLRDTLSRGFLILLRVWWLRSGGGGVAFGDGNPFEPLA